MFCQYCSKAAKNQRSQHQHEIRCKENSNRIIVISSHGMLGKKGSNQYIKGTAKPISEKGKEAIRESNKNRIWTEAAKTKHSVSMKKAVENNPESYSSSNRGRTKQIIVDNIKLQGQWEVEFYNWAKRQGLNPKRPDKHFEYEYNGTRRYFPDFYIEIFDLYVEVKGYETEKDRAKWSQFPNKLRVIKEKEIKQIKKNIFTIASLA